MIEMSIQIDQSSVNRVAKAIDYYTLMMGRTVESGVHSMASFVCKSLGADVKKAPEKRPIVRNPFWEQRASEIEMERIEGMKGNRGGRWKVNMKKFRQSDKRRAQFGVWKYKQNKPRVFVPIYRTGEYGNVRFVDKKTGQDLRFASQPTFRLSKSAVIQEAGFTQNNVENNPKRIIGRRGMGKASFGWLAKGATFNNGGSVNNFFGGHGASLSVAVGGKYADTSITINNRLTYITEALKGGQQDVNAAVGRATNAMFGYVNKRMNFLSATSELYK